MSGGISRPYSAIVSVGSYRIGNNKISFPHIVKYNRLIVNHINENEMNWSLFICKLMNSWDGQYMVQ